MNKMPVIFIGHGSPMNAIEDNEFSRTWKALSRSIPKPKAILCISAHWYVEGTAVTAMEDPKTIYDFYGFPEELYEVEYSAKGDIKLAEKIKNSIKKAKVELDLRWGLDHGTWSVLKHMYPKADIPVLELSINAYMPCKKHYEIGKELAFLRNEGVLIVGSGNLVHNLMVLNWDEEAGSYDWAVSFDKFVKESIENKDHNALINYTERKDSHLAHPTNDHYLPLLYVIGASGNEKPQFFNEKLVMGSISMRGVVFSDEALRI